MKKMRIVILVLIFIMLFEQTTILAIPRNQKDISQTQYDPRIMTIEERMKWMDENVEPIYGQATQLYRDEWLYTSLNTTYAGPEDAYFGKVETRVKFLCDSQYTEVVDWGTATYRATPLQGSIVDTEAGSVRIDSDNVRLWYTTWFVNYLGAYCVDIWYNVYGDGNYSIQVYK